MAYKIAVTGSAGIGKTTLAKALADTLGLTYIPEHYEPFFDSVNLSETPADEQARIFNRVLKHKHELEAEAGSFIVDRSPIDLFHFWQVRNLNKLSSETSDFLSLCAKYSQGYDYIILPPWGSFPLKQLENPPDQKRRNMDPWAQLRNHATITGYLYLFLPPVKIIQIPRNIVDGDKRIGFVLKQMERRDRHKSTSRPGKA